MDKLAKIINDDVATIKPPRLEGKVVLLTGASGLLGNYFLAVLKKSKAKVIAVTKTGLPTHFVSFLNKQSNVFTGDLTNPVFIKKLPEADVIIHAAGYGQPGRFLENPIKTLKINTTVTLQLLEKLKPKGKFLFISTSELYSGLKKPPFGESQIGTTNPSHPRSCYIEGKRCGEAIVNAYRQMGVSAKSARLALAYGPGTRPGDKRVLNSFIEKGLSGEIVLIDRGKSFRTYCYVRDAIKILLLILFFGKENVYNVGGNSRLTIAQLAKKIGKHLRVSVKFPLKNKTVTGAPDDVYLDMTRVEKEFGKMNYVNVDEGLRRTIEWQRELYKNEKNK